MKKRISCIILLVFCIILSACGKEIKFSEKGEMAVDNIKKLQSYMKAPDTFILRDDVLVLDENEKIFVFISYSAENSFGVPLQDMAVFYGGEYYGSYYDMEKNQQISREAYETEEAYEEALEKRKLELLCVIKFNQWVLGEIEDYEVIPCKNIAEKLGIKYQTDNH